MCRCPLHPRDRLWGWKQTSTHGIGRRGCYLKDRLPDLPPPSCIVATGWRGGWSSVPAPPLQRPPPPVPPAPSLSPTRSVPVIRLLFFFHDGSFPSRPRPPGRRRWHPPRRRRVAAAAGAATRPPQRGRRGGGGTAGAAAAAGHDMVGVPLSVLFCFLSCHAGLCLDGRGWKGWGAGGEACSVTVAAALALLTGAPPGGGVPVLARTTRPGSDACRLLCAGGPQRGGDSPCRWRE